MERISEIIGDVEAFLNGEDSLVTVCPLVINKEDYGEGPLTEEEANRRYKCLVDYFIKLENINLFHYKH